MAKLLIIDDERGIRNTLREILADEGHEVEIAETRCPRWTVWKC